MRTIHRCSLGHV